MPLSAKELCTLKHPCPLLRLTTGACLSTSCLPHLRHHLFIHAVDLQGSHALCLPRTPSTSLQTAHPQSTSRLPTHGPLRLRLNLHAAVGQGSHFLYLSHIPVTNITPYSPTHLPHLRHGLSIKPRCQVGRRRNVVQTPLLPIPYLLPPLTASTVVSPPRLPHLCHGFIINAAVGQVGSVMVHRHLLQPRLHGGR